MNQIPATLRAMSDSSLVSNAAMRGFAKRCAEHGFDADTSAVLLKTAMDSELLARSNKAREAFAAKIKAHG